VDQSPSITIVFPPSGIPGTRVNIYGYGFSTVLNNNIVKFGNSTATIVSASQTKLEVEVPDGTYGPSTVFVEVNSISKEYSGNFIRLNPSLYRSGFSEQQVISVAADGAVFVTAADLDSDDMIDVISTSVNDNKIAWYKNLGSGTFGNEQIITTQVDGPRMVHAADLDMDGDLDLLSVSYDDDKLAYYENFGTGNFGNQLIINDQMDGAYSVYASDLDLDGDLDVIAVSMNDYKIAWYENFGGLNFSSQKIISTASQQPIFVLTADIDNDGDFDVLSASAHDNKIASYENLGDGTFASQKIISTECDLPHSLYVTDIGGSTNYDIISASQNDDKIAWFRNLGNGNFSNQNVITTNADAAYSVYACDLDNDGDNDALSASVFDNKVSWYENLGDDNFSIQRVISTQANSPYSVFATDLDSDGDMDVLSASTADKKIAWYENLSVPASINITHPNLPGELLVGEIVEVRWTSLGVDSVLVEYSTDSGSTWSLVTQSSIVNTGLYSWAVPNSPSANCRVKISDAANASIFDISDYDFTISQGDLNNLELISRLATRGGRRITISGDHAYLANISNVEIVNIQNPETPFIEGEIVTQDQCYSLTVSENILFLLIYNTNQLAIYDCQNPANPIPLGTANTSSNPRDIKVTQHYAYIATRTTGLEIFNISNLSNPIKVGDISSDQQQDGLFVHGDYAYIANTGEGLNIYDVSNPENPNLVGNYYREGGIALDVVVSNNIAYVGWHELNGSIEYIDVTDKSNPVLLHSDITGWNPEDLSLYDKFLGVALTGEGGGLFVFDVTDPLIPTEYGSYKTGMLYGVDINNGIIYINDYSGYLVTLGYLEEQSSISVASPNNSSVWTVGTSEQIRWQSEGVTNVKIEYSTNNGSIWTLVSSSYPAHLNSYNWTIPNTPSELCKVRVSDKDNSQVFSLSDGTFSIVGTSSLTLNSPNGGEQWKAGETHQINWSSDGVSNIKIEYSTNNGISWNLISSSFPAHFNSFNWVIPAVSSSFCKVKISDVANSQINDISNNAFSIKNPTLQVVSPNGGETWYANDVEQITWSSQDVDNIKIEYTTNNGSSWNLIETSISANPNSYNWNVPSAASTQCKIRIMDLLDSQIQDESNSQFSILSTFIDLTSPNGGEVFQVGNIEQITWLSGGVSELLVEFTTDNGNTWNEINSSVDASLQKYNWEIPNTVSDLCKVRITNVSDTQVQDESEGTFRIISPAIQITSPSGGESWIVGSSQIVSWTSEGISDPLNILLSTDGGLKFDISLKTNTANDGIDTIVVPSNTSDNCRIKIESSNDSNIFGINPAAFSIIQLVPIISLSENWIQFGEVAINNSSSKKFIVRNIGDLDLTVSSISSSENSFSVDKQSFSVVPQDSIDVNITFTPTEGRNYSDSLIILHNASDGQSVINLSGIGLALPSIALSQSSIDFGEIMAGRSKSEVFSITNNGDADLVINQISSNNNVFSLSASSGLIKPDSTSNFMVTFSPHSDSLYQSNIEISHNAPEQISNIVASGSGFTYPQTYSLQHSTSFGNAYSIADYRMVGIPGQVDQPITNYLSGSYGEEADWRAFYDNGDSTNYLIEYNGSEIFRFKPGNGFWILSKSDFNVAENISSVQLDDNYYYGIQLHFGWNIISNPFNKTLLWDDIKSINSISENIFEFNGSYNSALEFKPFTGYYFYNVSGLDTLHIPYKKPNNSSLVSKSVQNYKTLKLSLYQDGNQSSVVEIGISKNASEWYDRLDAFAPPSDFLQNSLRIHNESVEGYYKYLMKDYRSEIEEGKAFNLSIEKSENTNLILVAEGLDNFDDQEIYLFDERLNDIYNLKESSEIAIKSLHTFNNYKLLIGTEAYINSIKNNLLPQEFILYQNYPNPFNPRTIIRFALKEKSSVSLKLFSILGEEITTVIDQVEYDAGYHELEFIADKMTSGVYIYRIEAGNFTSSKKMIVLK
jgi:hypothetical protein